MIGIVVGMALFIAMIGLGNGLRIAITNQFNIAGPDIITIQASGGGQGPPGQGVVTPLEKDLIPKINSLSAVDSALCILIQSVTMEVNNIQTFEFVQSTPSSGYELREFIDRLNINMEEGRFFRDNERGKVVLGYSFLENEAKFDRRLRVGQSVIISGKRFQILGFTEKRGSFILDGSIRMNEDDIRDIAGEPDECSFINVRARSNDDVPRAREQIERLMRNERNVREGNENFRVTTADQSLSTINSILDGIQVFILIIAAISLIVGSIGIVNTMFTAVLERRKEIGIMKAIGAKNEDIFGLFFIESGLLGFIGGALGILIGYLIALGGTSALATFFNTTSSPDITITLILFTLFGSFILGSISGIVPALQAAKLQPVQALRS
ncbi:MAG: ABC transporter permease [Candidatus Woesearchaeota archaeon]